MNPGIIPVLFLFVTGLLPQSSAINSEPTFTVCPLRISERHSHMLPEELTEISGLAYSDDGRLFAHNDEHGVIFQLDPQSGAIIKRFYVGIFTLKGDFEGIAIAGTTFYLVSSEGNIFAFEEGRNKGRVRYDVYKTNLTSKQDVEGLCYDPETNCLLLACKGEPLKGNKDDRAVYAFSLTEKELLPQPRFVLREDLIEQTSPRGNFSPSGIERHPVKGTFCIVAAHGNAFLEMDRKGSVLGYQELDKNVHPQPEGITISPDGEMLIGDEGGKESGKLTVYTLSSKSD